MIMSLKFRLLRLSLASASLSAMAIAAAPAAAQAPERTYNIPAQPLSAALLQFSKQSDVLVVVAPDVARGKKSKAVTGSMPAADAIAKLLRGTGLRAISNPSGGYRIERGASSPDLRVKAGQPIDLDASGQEAGVPEILVVAPNNWSLNTGIARTEDDTQPYVVFNKEQIQRSGSSNLEDFFRDYLGSNTSAASSNQNGFAQGRTNINLRGLGSDETLILVDGRRIPGVNAGSGILEQGSINGIPLASIERIEVLASSASGIYGSSATGGVINIILRRDFRGIQASATYGSTFEGGGTDRRLDLTGGLPLEGGRTNISFSASARKTSPLLVGDRDLVQRGRQLAFDVNPTVFVNRGQPPLGATPNIRSASGGVLTLDPIYGGASLGSNITFIPTGFRGIGQDGVAGLVANAGKYNLDLAPTANSNGGDGAKTSILSGDESLSGSIAIRREFTPWLKAYVEGALSFQRTKNIYNRVGTNIQLAANSPNNPFQQAILVTVPHVGADADNVSRNSTRRLLAGAIVKLPFDWQAVTDFSWSRNRFSLSNQSGIDLATSNGLLNGTLDVMRDLAVAPLTYGYLEGDFASRRSPSISKTQTASLRLAGPLPVTLPGGKPVVTLLLERNRDFIASSLAYNNGATSSSVNFTPERTQVTKSIYGEIRLPIVGSSNNIPLIEELEVQVAGRYDQYIGTGADTNLACFSVAGPLPASAFELACPPPGQTFAIAKSKRSVVDPTISLRWKPIEDITFRASYAKGFLPPYLSQLIKIATPVQIVSATDPERGNEPIGAQPFPFPGIPFVLQGPGNFLGGNPDVRPETSQSWTAGVILTPRFLPGLRFAVDWTKIRKKNNYFSPIQLLGASNIPGGQEQFEDFLRLNPGRFTRGPASGGFAVGPITAIDASIANLAGSTVEAIDFSLDYRKDIGGGTLNLAADATYLHDLSLRTSPSAPLIQSAGVLSNLFSQGLGSEGGLRWKGNASAVYSTDKWSLGWRSRYYDSYYLSTTKAVVPAQGTAKIPSIMFHDLFGSYRLFSNTELRAGVNNIFNKKPRIDVSFSNFYSRLGDPRLANFYLSITQGF